MSLRALWMIAPSSEPTSNDWSVVFQRKFSTVEQRAKSLLITNYEEIPADKKTVAKAIAIQVGLHKPTADKFIEERDSCARSTQMPVVEITFGDTEKKLWPVVVVEHSKNLLCCLPLVEKNITKDDLLSLVELPSISMALHVLQELRSFLSQSAFRSQAETVAELNKYVAKVLPFGRPSETNCDAVKAALAAKSLTVSNNKQPSQKFSLVTKNRLQITVTEKIHAAVYNKDQVQDLIEIYGTVSWRGNLESNTSDVTLSLASQKRPLMAMESVALHPCATSLDSESGLPTASKKLRFVPVSNSLDLCYYTVKANALPIGGSYKMRFKGKIEFLLQLQLSSSAKNSFEFCEVHLPFQPHKIVTVKIKPNWGSVSKSVDKSKLIWSVGQKFPNNSAEISLEGTLQLETSPSKDAASSLVSNAYALVRFAIRDFTFSGFEVNAKTVQVTPTTKSKITCTKEFVASDYVLWNTWGHPPIGFRELKNSLS